MNYEIKEVKYNDIDTLCYVNDVVLNKKYKKIHLMPGAGCNKNSTVIQLYMAWNKPFLILIDGDKAGEKSKNEYIKLFGEPIKECIKLTSDALSDASTLVTN